MIKYEKQILLSLDAPINFGNRKELSLKQLSEVDPEYFMWMYDDAKPFIIMSPSLKKSYARLADLARKVIMLHGRCGVDDDRYLESPWDIF
jgi:hypothetical protein